MRNKFLIANFKMHKTRREAFDYLARLNYDPLVTIGIAPPFTLIQDMKNRLPSPHILIGAQNFFYAHEGSFTGEISSAMLKDVGADFVIIGHSERRNIFHEDDEMVQKKVERAIVEGMLPILCIGESLEQRNASLTSEVLTHEIESAVQSLTEDQVEKVVIAYEPLWAIGADKSASPFDIEEANNLIRDCIKNLFGSVSSQTIRILYGGSVDPSNIGEILKKADPDGFLIGRSSLNAETFNEMLRISSEISSKGELS